MDSLLSLGLYPVGKVKDACEATCKTSNAIFPPEDKHNMVYISLVFAGLGFLLPYNSFITAVDYFHSVFPGTTIVFDISLIYILTSLIAVLLSNVIIFTFSLTSRIMFGYILSLFILTFLLVFIIWLNTFSQNQSYVMILICVALISLGATGWFSGTLHYITLHYITLHYIKV